MKQQQLKCHKMIGLSVSLIDPRLTKKHIFKKIWNSKISDSEYLSISP